MNENNEKVKFKLKSRQRNSGGIKNIKHDGVADTIKIEIRACVMVCDGAQAFLNCLSRLVSGMSEGGGGRLILL